MPTNTPRLGLSKYAKGETDWTHSDLVQWVEENAVQRDTFANRPASGEYDGELFLATDRRILYQWDATNSQWDPVTGMGTSQNPLPGTVHREAVSTEGETLSSSVIRAHYPAAGTYKDYQLADFPGAASAVEQAFADAGNKGCAVELPMAKLTWDKTLVITTGSRSIIGKGHGGNGTFIDCSSLSGSAIEIGDANNFAENILLRDFRIHGDGTQTGACIEIRHSRNIHFYNIYQKYHNIGVRAKNDVTSNKLIDHYQNQCVWEGNAGTGVVIDASGSTQPINRYRFDSCYSFNNGGHGLRMIGIGGQAGNGDSFRFNSGEYGENDQTGIRLEGTRSPVFAGTWIHGNNQSAGGYAEVEHADDANGNSSRAKYLACTIDAGGGTALDIQSAAGGFTQLLGGAIGGSDSIAFPNNTVHNRTQITSLQGYQNADWGYASDIANAQTISYDLDDAARFATLVTKTNDATFGIANVSLASFLSGGSFDIAAENNAGTALDGTEGVDLYWAVFGRTYPAGGATG